MHAHRAIVRVLIVTVMVAASGSARAANADGRELPARSGNPTMERQFKGQLDPIGPFSWLDLSGRRWTERDFSGKVLIMQQWAAWCGPCVAEFPQVQRLFDSVHHDPSIAFVSLDMDRDPAAIREFLQEFRKEYSFPVLFAGRQLRINALPYTWIVDRDGYIRDGFVSGPDLVERALELAEAVKHRLPVSALPPEARQERRKQNERDGADSR
jgi:thiol-disulfide isomerase/thioredoxin